MQDFSLRAVRYSAERSPAAMAAAIAFNGGMIALLLTLPVSRLILPQDPPLKVYQVRAAAPHPKTEPPVPERHRPAQAVMRKYHVQDPAPELDPLAGIGRLKGLEGSELPLSDLPPLAEDPPRDPPRAAVVVKAWPDPSFAAAFHPPYPPSMAREGVEGQVTVRVTIDERGRVVAVEQVSATNAVFFEQTKSQALRFWRFVPATRDGRAIRSEQNLTVHFRLE